MTATPLPIDDIDDLFIPLPCGTRLAARLWRAQGIGQLPAVLEFIPYRKRDATLPRDEAIHPWMAARGYACLRVDLRGAGDSEGVFDDEYSPQELQDACEVIAWIAAQDWCTGAVGMMGKSWGGFNALQTAALAPPALKAVVTVCSSTDRFADDIHFKGGCLLGANFDWGTLMLAYCSRPADPLLRPDWREDWLRRLRTMPHAAALWAGHQVRDAYWRHGSVCENYSAIRAPVLTIGGWADNYMNTPAHLVENLSVPAKAILGPWVHQYPHQAVPAPRIGFLAEMQRWWDRWLKDVPNGAEGLPDYRVFMQDSTPPNSCAAVMPGRWLAETLPSPRVAPMTLVLGNDGRLAKVGNTAGGQAARGGALSRPIATPHHLGALAGEYFPMGLSGEMPDDQATDDALSVCFDLDCPEGLALMGRARLNLTLSADAPFGFIVARLCDVAPDGRSRRIAHGMLNLHHRADPPAPMEPGQPVTASFDLDQMACRLAPGHRLRLALSNSYWPFLTPSPAPVVLTLHRGALTLPVHSGTAPECSFPPAETDPPPRQETLSVPYASRVLRHDIVTGQRMLEIVRQSGRQRHPDHGLETESHMHSRWAIRPDDPLSCEAQTIWEHRFARASDWAVRTRVEAAQTLSADHIHLRATLSAFETGPDGTEVQVFSRNFQSDVPRVHI